ncbi:hypothetical protein CCR75_006336 [Bremia lactucae]|uniref:Uncharacterized protein n=1 Tax=Bremia lactucae TaxID=4779 RepID=A0A976FR23_BRELC|nr:hypothetical protein CCR75_006336 [Bremia lactucae]
MRVLMYLAFLSVASGNFFTDYLNNIGDATDNAAQQAKEEAADLTDHAVAKVGNTTGKAFKGVGNAATDTANFFNHIGDKLEN